MYEEAGYDVLALTETHCANPTHGRRLLMSAPTPANDRFSGVALMISDRMACSLTFRRSVSSRIVFARFRGRYTNLTIIAVYMPASVRSNPSQEDTYKDLRQILNKVSKHDTVILMADFNAKLARGPDAYVGRWCIHTHANAAGQRLRCLLEDYDLFAVSTAVQLPRGRQMLQEMKDGKTCAMH